MPKNKKRGRQVTSSSSTSGGLEPDDSALDSSVFSITSDPSKFSNTNQKTKQRKMDDSRTKEVSSTSIEQQLLNISTQLSGVLTKNDRDFIKEIIITTVEEIKEHILKSVTKRIEVLESEINDACMQSDNLKKDLQKKDKHIDSLKEENNHLKTKLKAEENARKRDINDLEQYGRRNSVRIRGIRGDADKQTSEAVSDLVVKTLNENSDLNLKKADIDITHRLGRWTRGTDRAIVVKFVRRQTKIDVMKRAKTLRTNKIYVNEDLTWLNQQVLSSLRIKDPDYVTKCWSFEGKIFALYKDSARPTEVKFSDYETWLAKPWPAR